MLCVKYAYQKIGIVCIFVFMSLLFSASILKAEETDDMLSSKFKSMGIIPLYNILPPADDLLSDMDGNPVKLSDFKGKIVFLNFWTTWCPDCVYEMPAIERLQEKSGAKEKDFTIIALDLRESEKKVSRFVEKFGLAFTVLLDKKGSMGRAFGIRTIPTTFILNRQGGLIGKAMGPRDWGSQKSIDLFTYIIDHY